MIIKKSRAEIDKMYKAGQLVARAHEEIMDALKPGMSTMDLDQIAEKVIRGAGGIPSFVGYRGFPATLCTSKNNEIVHGIPSRDITLEEGDLIKVDCGAIVDGYHGDSATTLIVGGDDAVPAEVLQLVKETRRGLWNGLVSAAPGARLGDLGAAIESAATPHGYGVVREYVGHGIGRALHEDPSVPNYGREGKGLKLSKGWVIAIEPMFNLGTRETVELDDGWTVVTADGSLSSHWEHTVAVTEDGPWILTARHDEPEHPTLDNLPVI